MSLLVVMSAKHSPGASTLAVAIAAACAGRDPLVVEADVAGGDLAARAGLSVEPGLLTLAAAGRRGVDERLVGLHGQRLANGTQVLVSPCAPRLATTALKAVAADLFRLGCTRDRLTIVDLGRFDPHSPASGCLDRADTIVTVFRPTVEGVEHLRELLHTLQDCASRLVAVAVGDQPYGVAEVAGALAGREVHGVAFDAKAAQLVGAGATPDRWLRRTAYVRSVASLVDALALRGEAEAA